MSKGIPLSVRAFHGESLAGLSSCILLVHSWPLFRSQSIVELNRNSQRSEGGMEGMVRREQRTPGSDPQTWRVWQKEHGSRGLSMVELGSGYVVGLVSLLTGLPPFMTAGSVLLLGGTAGLGTVSPTSCNDGSRYIATAKDITEGKSQSGNHICLSYWRGFLRPTRNMTEICE